MTTPDDPTVAGELHTADVPRERVWERVRDVDRNWNPEREGVHSRVRDRDRGRDRFTSANGPSRVLVPFDDSGPAYDALEAAFDLFPDAAVTALTIVDDSTVVYAPAPSTEPRASTDGELLAGRPAELERAIEIADRCDERIRTAGRVGSATQGILEYVTREAVDHVVIGSHCRSGLARFLQGSVAETVVRHSPVPVTVIPASSLGGD
ncbi:universal stress protein [Halopiger aswanensis]|uniref:Nucleotide-binding universal stress UspA family protein n=1 Tax=Halopiger aswanensis TaxID=148449 RepID=A0A3R7HXA5_9EURY|nr:universal stress protein [Halopiger aswanensis]RKD94781.1 nucleotide-binding universal stress UspA family protein [Halopiger aswanensis]